MSPVYSASWANVTTSRLLGEPVYFRLKRAVYLTVYLAGEFAMSFLELSANSSISANTPLAFSWRAFLAHPQCDEMIRESSLLYSLTMLWDEWSNDSWNMVKRLIISSHSLRRLELKCINSAVEGTMRFALSSENRLPPLRSLRLINCGLGPGEAEAWAHSIQSESLEHLAVRGIMGDFDLLSHLTEGIFYAQRFLAVAAFESRRVRLGSSRDIGVNKGPIASNKWMLQHEVSERTGKKSRAIARADQRAEEGIDR
jgi:hypothetical protein